MKMRFLTLLVTGSLLASTTIHLSAQNRFVRGDCDNDGAVTIGDPVFLFFYSFVPFSGLVPRCWAACDADDDNNNNALLDGLTLLTAIFDPGAPPIPPPYPDCGPDPTPGALTCDEFVCTGVEPPLAPDARVTLPEVVAATGRVVELDVVLEAPEHYLTAWSLGVCHDSSLVEVASVEEGARVLEANDGKGPDYSASTIYPGQGWTVGVVLSILFEETLPAGPGSIHRVTYQVNGEGHVPLLACDSLGDPPVRNIVTGWETGVPVIADGSILASNELFRRGDADGDGIFNGLIDGITILSFGFVPGSPAPPCFDAADADDDGMLNSLVDALFVLRYQFLPGNPVPPPPGPFDCGVDPSFDTLGCVPHHGCP